MSTKQEVVLKVVFPDPDLDPEAAATASPTPNQLNSFRREIDILAMVGQHPNVAGLLGITSDFRVLVLQEAMIDLHKMIKSQKRGLALSVVRRWSHELLAGTAYLHSISIMHRDLKPSNLLIHRDMTLKIGDFGLSCMADVSETLAVRREMCTVWYRAPELIMGADMYSASIDVWSCGIIILEMLVGRSRPFVQYLGPLLERHLGLTGPAVGHDNLYRLLTRVRRSPVRVDADELTYPLHVMHRFDLEKQLLSGQLAVRHLRDAWNAGMEQRLELTPADDLEGVLQDVHWAQGQYACYPLYLVGAAIAAQLAEGLRRAVPDLDAQIAVGDFSGLMGWLREAVHCHGARLSAQDLIREATGRPISAASALRYLESKYLDGSPASSEAA